MGEPRKRTERGILARCVPEDRPSNEFGISTVATRAGLPACRGSRRLPSRKPPEMNGNEREYEREKGEFAGAELDGIISVYFQFISGRFAFPAGCLGPSNKLNWLRDIR